MEYSQFIQVGGNFVLSLLKFLTICILALPRSIRLLLQHFNKANSFVSDFRCFFSNGCSGLLHMSLRRSSRIDGLLDSREVIPAVRLMKIEYKEDVMIRSLGTRTCEENRCSTTKCCREMGSYATQARMRGVGGSITGGADSQMAPRCMKIHDESSIRPT